MLVYPKNVRNEHLPENRKYLLVNFEEKCVQFDLDCFTKMICQCLKGNVEKNVFSPDLK